MKQKEPKTSNTQLIINAQLSPVRIFLKKNIAKKMKEKEEEKMSNVLDFRNKNSLIYKMKDEVANPKDLEFCMHIVEKLSQTKSSTSITPFSIATLNADNGLRKKGPLTYKEKIDTEAIRKAD